MTENLKPRYRALKDAVADGDPLDITSTMIGLSTALAQEILQLVPCGTLTAPAITAACRIAENVIKAQPQTWAETAVGAEKSIYNFATSEMLITAVLLPEVDADD
jgi:hypothetical protein